jgi:tetratricopeptide (TPR) repeat protein
MKRLLLLAALAATLGCSAIHDLQSKNDDSYANPFWAKYLNTGSGLDAQIQRTLEAVRQRPDSPELHNTLGTLLVEKGFPKDAEREFERAVDANRRYHPAWYNLGLVRASRGDEIGARRAFQRTINLKPGHGAALFQLGLVEERRQHVDRAVSLYAKAYSINPTLLDIDVNPRILDSKLTSLALLKMYPSRHARLSAQFQGSIPVQREPVVQQAPSPQAPGEKIVTPAAPVTDPSQQHNPRPPAPTQTTTPTTTPAKPPS